MFDLPIPSSETLKPHDIVSGIYISGYYDLKKVKEVKEDSFSYVDLRESKAKLIEEVFEMRYHDIGKEGQVIFMRRIEKTEKGNKKYGLEVVAASSSFIESYDQLEMFYIRELASKVRERIGDFSEPCYY